MAEERGEATVREEREEPAAVAPAPAAVVQSAVVYGVVMAFDDTKEDWAEYTERLENYFEANDIGDAAKKRAILLNAVGPATYRLIKTLALPGVPRDLTFEQIVSKVKLHFNPRPSPIMKRYEFNTRVQGEGESVGVFVAALRKIAEHCEYGEALNDMLRDRIVCGIRSKELQTRMLQKPELTYAKAVDLALTAEAAAKNAKRLQQGGTAEQGSPKKADEDINRVQNGRDSRNPRPPKPSKDAGQHPPLGDCYRCGGKHSPARCKFREAECHYCKRKGHIIAVCRKKAAAKAGTKSDGPREKANWVEEGTPEKELEDPYRLYKVNGGSSRKPILVGVTVNGVDLEMELDTGASVSLISEETFHQLKGTGATLGESRARLFTYTDEQIKVVGSTRVKAEHNGQIADLPLVVTGGTGPSLLGRDWLAALKLNWQEIFQIKATRSLQSVLDQYSDVFTEELGEIKGVEATIRLDSDATPIFLKARPVPYSLREKVEADLERLQRQGVIEPVQFSEWATPIVPVEKANGGVRICGDYRATVNKVTKADTYPLPRIEDLFASLAGGEKFSKLDLSHAYEQLKLDDESCKYCTINTHKGLFAYKRMPFGITSAPSIFQRVMEGILQGIPGVCVYIDDILVTGRTEAEHLEHLAEVLRRLAEAGVRLKKEKCHFMLDSVEYLGHVVSSQGLHTSEAKTKAMVEAPTPRNVTELRSFLGLVNYYGKFLPDLATTLAPLYSLLQKEKKWTWGRSQNQAFKAVKEQLKSPHVLTHFDDSLPLVLSCDASPYGVGAVLSHRMSDGSERPVGYASRALTKAEKKYAQIDKEALAIVFGVKKYHQYLYGRHFVVKTDHKPLTHIFSESRTIPAMASGRIQRWALTLGAYNYTIEFKQGKENANADALSRLPLPTQERDTPRPAEVVHLLEHLDASPVSSSQIRVWTNHDPILSKVKGWVLSGWPAADSAKEFQPYFRRKDELTIEEGCLLWGNRVVVPPKGRSKIIKILHEAHPGIARMKGFARVYVWWPGMDKELENCVKNCEICQVNRKSPPSVPLQPWTWPDKPWSRVHVDYAGPFCGKMFLLMIDAHSKWLEVHMSNLATSAVTISHMRKSFASFGLPEVIVSDNATTFTSEEFRQFLNRNGIRHVLTPPYHPASNGLAERAVQTFKEGMKKLSEGSLETKLARFLFKYRLTPHSTTGVSPSELMFGRRLRSHLDMAHPDLRRKTRDSQDRQKQNHDLRAREREFKLGDWVYVRNFRTGPMWLPGRITGLQGSVMYTVLLEDGRVVCKHADHLRARTHSSGRGPRDEEMDIVPEVDDDEEVTDTPPAATEPQGDSPTTEEPEPVQEPPFTIPQATPPEPNLPDEPGEAEPETGAVPAATSSGESTTTPSTVPTQEQRQSSRSHVRPDYYGDFIFT